MKTAFSIYMDYKNAMQQAEALDRAAADIRSELSSLHEAKEDIRSSWSGEPAEEYIRRISVTESDLRKLAESVSKAAGTTRRIAIITYEAEQRAIELASARTY